MNDNDGATSQAATISVLVNDPPVANDDDGSGGTQTTDEDTPLSVNSPGILENDTDDSNPVSIQVAEFTYSDETCRPGNDDYRRKRQRTDGECGWLLQL